MAKINNFICAICRIKKNINREYKTDCKKSICKNCLKTDIVKYDRLKCPFCRVDYDIDKLPAFIGEILERKKTEQTIIKLLNIKNNYPFYRDQIENYSKLFEFADIKMEETRANYKQKEYLNAYNNSKINLVQYMDLIARLNDLRDDNNTMESFNLELKKRLKIC